jgi:predicted house-cleaning noncanonical NTP pyrophosphatase (MazG superfamily)
VPEKLIRDKVAGLAAVRGDLLRTRHAAPAEVPGLLRDKLQEEVREYLDGGDPAELADVLQVLLELAGLHGCTPAVLDAQRRAKGDRAGYFADRTVLIYDDEPAASAATGWPWEVEGLEVPASPGSMEHVLTDSGTIEAEMAGDVVIRLAEHGPFWDRLDTGRPFTLRIGPGGG